MPDRPTTKDLITKARVAAGPIMPSERGGIRGTVHALADRLEEVEEERGVRGELLSMVWETLVRLLGEDAMERTPPMMYPEAIMTACAKVGKLAAETGNPTPDLPLAEPSDPEPEDVLRTSAPAQVPATGCEPEDDPWEEIEGWLDGDLNLKGPKFVARALLELRKREEETRRWHLALVGLVSRMEGRLDTLGTEMRERVTKIERQVEAIMTHAVSDEAHEITRRRITTLEGHADRGNEAEKGLRDWIHRLIQEDNHARKVRGTLRDDLEKIDDFTEALAERVDRLEALDRATTTVHDNLIEELIGRVEALEEERKVSLEARRHLLDEVQKLWKRLDGEA